MKRSQSDRNIQLKRYKAKMEFTEKRSLYYRTLFWTLFLSCILLRAAYGETHYVTDILILNLREGPGIDHKVIRTLKSNMPVEILEESDLYLKVRTKEDEIGWVEKQYITTEAPKTILIEKMKKDLSELTEKNSKLETNLTSLRRDLHSTRLRVKELEEEIGTGKNELTRKDSELKRIADKDTAIFAQKQGATKQKHDDIKYKDENTELKQKLKAVEKENRQLRIKQMIWWFVAGGAVFLIGLITGRILSRRPGKKMFY